LQPSSGFLESTKRLRGGNSSIGTAMKTYALVQKCDFEDVGMDAKSDAASDAILAADAKSDAESASMTEQKPRKKSTVENSNSLPCISVGDIGLEPTTSTMSTWRSSQLS
jgi:hypothetical protein